MTKTPIISNRQGRKTSPEKKRLFCTLEPKPKRLSQTVHNFHRNPEDKYIVNPASKIKKHLIDRIDILEIQKVMFKKPKTLNVYEQFCKNLQEKGPSQVPSSLYKTVKIENEPQ